MNLRRKPEPTPWINQHNLDGAVLSWHDSHSLSTTRAFAKLRRYRRAYEKPQSSSVRMWRFVVMLTLAVMVVVVGSLANLWLFGSAVAAIGVFAFYDLVWPRIARRRWQQLDARIRRGDFGYTIMLDVEPLWDHLDGALRAAPFRRNFMWIIGDRARNEAARPLLSAYLINTWHERFRLSQSGSDHTDLHLRAGAAELAAAIMQELHAQKLAG